MSGWVGERPIKCESGRTTRNEARELPSRKRSVNQWPWQSRDILCVRILHLVRKRRMKNTRDSRLSPRLCSDHIISAKFALRIIEGGKRGAATALVLLPPMQLQLQLLLLPPLLLLLVVVVVKGGSRLH